MHTEASNLLPLILDFLDSNSFMESSSFSACNCGQKAGGDSWCLYQAGGGARGQGFRRLQREGAQFHHSPPKGFLTFGSVSFGGVKISAWTCLGRSKL